MVLDHQAPLFHKCRAVEGLARATLGHMRYLLHVHDEGDGMLWATVEGLPGCFASGASADDLSEAAAEAVTLCR